MYAADGTNAVLTRRCPWQADFEFSVHGIAEATLRSKPAPALEVQMCESEIPWVIHLTYGSICPRWSVPLHVLSVDHEAAVAVGQRLAHGVQHDVGVPLEREGKCLALPHRHDDCGLQRSPRLCINNTADVWAVISAQQ